MNVYGPPADAGAEADAVEHDLIAPRITIEAFCVTEGFASTVQTATQDRRMAKTKSAVSMGGAAAAAKRYADVASPHLVIVESSDCGFELFSQLAALADVVDAHTRVIVAGPSNDVALYRELIRNGVSDYLVTPCAPMQAIEAVISAFETPDAAPAAASVVVYGVRGGVGASVLAHNLAAEIARRAQKETILVDLDLEFGTLGLNFNIETKQTVADAFADVEGLDDVKLARLLHAFDEQLLLLPAPADLSERTAPSEEAVLALLDVARRSSDQLVIDAPHGWTAATRVSLRQATTPVLVATPDLVSLRNLRGILDWLAQERPNDAAPKLALNQVGQPKRPEIEGREFAEILGAQIDLTLSWDPATFGQALNEGKLLRAAPAGRPHADAIRGLADQILGRDPSKSKSAGGVGRLLSAIGLGR